MTASRAGVLQLISSSGLYGAERVLLELARHIEGQGWRAHVGVFENRADPDGAGPLIEEARRHGLPVARFPCAGAFDGAAMAAIRRHVQQHGLDLVHSHNYKSDTYAYFSRCPARLVATCHNWLTDSPKMMLYELLDKLILHRFDRVVCVSPALERELAAAGIERRTLIDNGLSVELPPPELRQQTRQQLDLAPDAPVLIAIGRLDPWKDHALLLEALARPEIPADTRLLVVGDGDLRGELEARAASLGLGQRVVFTGYRRDVGALLQASDLFVVSSREEGLPMVLLEAMATSVPVVSTAVGGIPGAVRDGQEALLVPHGDAGALAAAVARALGDADGARRLAAGALVRFEERYSRRAMGERYLTLYRELLDLPAGSNRGCEP